MERSFLSIFNFFLPLFCHVDVFSLSSLTLQISSSLSWALRRRQLGVVFNLFAREAAPLDRMSNISILQIGKFNWIHCASVLFLIMATTALVHDSSTVDFALSSGKFCVEISWKFSQHISCSVACGWSEREIPSTRWWCCWTKGKKRIFSRQWKINSILEKKFSRWFDVGGISMFHRNKRQHGLRAYTSEKHSVNQWWQQSMLDHTRDEDCRW